MAITFDISVLDREYQTKRSAGNTRFGQGCTSGEYIKARKMFGYTIRGIHELIVSCFI